MSYCRWSSDSFRCDLYCYEDVSGGWTTHVANRRYVMPDDMRDPFEAWSPAESDTLLGALEGHARFHEALKTIPMEDIALPHAGERFNDATLAEFRATLTRLRGVGYCYPDHVLEAVDAEIAEETARAEFLP